MSKLMGLALPVFDIQEGAERETVERCIHHSRRMRAAGSISLGGS
jgi:hypothetical protein